MFENIKVAEKRGREANTRADQATHRHCTGEDVSPEDGTGEWLVLCVGSVREESRHREVWYVEEGSPFCSKFVLGLIP